MRVITEAAQLIIRLEGWEMVWALKRTLKLPRDSIVEVNFTPEMPVLQDFSGFLRAPGTAVPRRFWAGSFWRAHKHEFWYIHSQQPGLLTIELKKDRRVAYDRVRLSCTSDVAAAVVDWWRHGSSKR